MEWQRNWFFWMESLQITAGERRVMMILLATSMIATGVARLGQTRTIYDQQYYEPVVAEFKRLSERHDRDRADLLARYYPPETHPSLAGFPLKMQNYSATEPLVMVPGEQDEISTARVRERSAGRKRNRHGTPLHNSDTGKATERHDIRADRGESDPDSEPGCETRSASEEEHNRITVRIQTAGKEELMTLPGIGPVTAERILIFREENGPIENVDDLLNVSGIGPVTIENIRDHIIFD